MQAPPDTTFKYDLCLSCAGEDRVYVDEIADALRERGVRLFYDNYEKAQLWGKDLYAHLDYIYRSSARFCIIFISAHYAKKLWTNHERQSAQARAFVENEEYILPVRFDDTEIPGIRPTIGYIDLRKTSAEELISLIIAKLAEFPRVQADQKKEIEFLLNTSLRFAELGSVNDLSSFLDEKLEPFENTADFKTLFPSYVVRFCQACLSGSCSLHSIISRFLLRNEEISFSTLLAAYPEGAPCSLRIVGQHPSPAVTELFARIFLTRPRDVNWETALKYLLNYGDSQDQVLVEQALYQEETNHALIQALVRLAMPKATEILGLRLRDCSPDERAFIVRCAEEDQTEFFKKILEEMLSAGLREPPVLSYLADHGSELARNIINDIQAEARKATVNKRHEEAWTLLKTQNEQQIAQFLSQINGRIQRLEREYEESWRNEPDPSPDDREQGFDVDGIFEEFYEKQKTISDELQAAQHEYQDFIAGFKQAVEKNPELRSFWERVLRLI